MRGSEKQIEWAGKIRDAVIWPTWDRIKHRVIYNQRQVFGVVDERAMIEYFKSRGCDTPEKVNDFFRRAYDLALEKVKSTESASWWIDNRNELSFELEKQTAISVCELLDPVKKLDKEPAALVAREEATLRPPKTKTETVCEIQYKEGELSLHFPERREDFRLLAHEHKFTWSGECWTRKADLDKAVEMGIRILMIGIPVLILDNEIRGKVIAGKYEPENTRQIKRIVSGPYTGRFAISWDRKTDADWYSEAKKLPGSKWHAGTMTVPAERFQEILDFSAMNDFKICSGAKILIEQMISARERMITVIPKLVPNSQVGKPKNKPEELDIPKNPDVADEFRE